MGFDLHGTQLGWGIGFASGHQGVADSFRSRFFVGSTRNHSPKRAEPIRFEEKRRSLDSDRLWWCETPPLQIFLWWRKISGRETFFAALFLDHLGPGGSHCGCICGMGPWIPMTSGNMVPCWFPGVGATNLCWGNMFWEHRFGITV